MTGDRGGREALRPAAEVLDELGVSGRGCLVALGGPEAFLGALVARLQKDATLYAVEPEGRVPVQPNVRHVRSLPRGVVPGVAIVWLSATRPPQVVRRLAPRLAPGARLWVVLPAGEAIESPTWNRAALRKAIAPLGFVERGAPVAVSDRREARLLGPGLVPAP